MSYGENSVNKKKSRDKKSRDGYGALNNLLYWLKALYRDFPLYVWLFAAEAVLSVGISLLGVYMPSALVADITKGRGLEMLLWDLAVLGGGLVCLYLMNHWLEKTEQVMTVEIGQEWGLRITEESLRADYANIERPDFPENFFEMEMRHRWNWEYSLDFMRALKGFATAATGMTLYVGMLSGVSPWILLPVIAGTAVSYWMKLRCNRWEAANRHKWIPQDSRMRYLAWSTSSYEAAKDVHLYWMPPWLSKFYNRELKERLKFTVRQQANYFLDGSVSGCMHMMWEGIAYFYLVYLVCEGRMDAAGFVLYFGIITGFGAWCEAIVARMRELHRKASYVEEHRKFFESLQRGEGGRKEELVLPEGHVPEIRFENVTFTYRGAETPVLKNLNLTIRPGENIALVGLNGAGKTTFIKLLCGFYQPTRGRILIDGVDRSRYSSESWLRCFTGVFQDAGLFPLSIRENLTMGGEQSGERMEECLKMADLEEKVGKLPEGLDTLFGRQSHEGAVEFSGGELQKLMLARALYRQAPILVLDEPTAALDPLAESRLYERYRLLSEGKTSLFISHRLASTRFCDCVLLMEDGSVAESGTHEELMEKDGKYAWMFRLQSRYYREEEERKEAGLA
ncbi:MAG: ABC transporter ATP-binding protein [Lachnospiraceae bacterium]|jgi:ATP-binding cassette subfamily B protein|nr:ABC transporter ATP-binding protein [Lachnospiraceae bacterium]